MCMCMWSALIIDYFTVEYCCRYEYLCMSDGASAEYCSNGEWLLSAKKRSGSLPERAIWVRSLARHGQPWFWELQMHRIYRDYVVDPLLLVTSQLSLAKYRQQNTLCLHLPHSLASTPKWEFRSRVSELCCALASRWWHESEALKRSCWRVILSVSHERPLRNARPRTFRKVSSIRKRVWSKDLATDWYYNCGQFIKVEMVSVQPCTHSHQKDSGARILWESYPIAAYSPAATHKNLPIPFFQFPRAMVRCIQDGHINHTTHMWSSANRVWEQVHNTAWITYHSKLVNRAKPERKGLLDNPFGGPNLFMWRRVYNPLHAVRLSFVRGAFELPSQL